MENTKIYYLHIGDNVPFYIGKTINMNNNSRLNAHKQVFGKNIFLEDLDIVLTKEWRFWEKYYISLFQSWGFKLLNKNKGGGGCITHNVNKEARQKISITHKGKLKPFSESHIKNLKISLQGKKVTWGDKIGKSLKNRKVTWKTGHDGSCRYSPINQYDLELNFIKLWPSVTEARNSIKGDISACCRGKQKTAGGFIFSYAS
jgi:hypothetical protein